MKSAGRDGTDVAWDFIRLAWLSVADLAVVPLHDLLDLPTATRMNRPGEPDGNWAWRVTDDQPIRTAFTRLRELTTLAGRDRPVREAAREKAHEERTKEP